MRQSRNQVHFQSWVPAGTYRRFNRALAKKRKRLQQIAPGAKLPQAAAVTDALKQWIDRA